MGGFKRLLALAAETDVEFEQAKTVSEDVAEHPKQFERTGSILPVGKRTDT